MLSCTNHLPHPGQINRHCFSTHTHCQMRKKYYFILTCHSWFGPWITPARWNNERLNKRALRAIRCLKGILPTDCCRGCFYFFPLPSYGTIVGVQLSECIGRIFLSILFFNVNCVKWLSCAEWCRCVCIAIVMVSWVAYIHCYWAIVYSNYNCIYRLWCSTNCSCTQWSSCSSQFALRYTHSMRVFVRAFLQSQ